MRKLDLPDEDIVLAYVNDFKSTIEIAKLYNCSSGCIERRLKCNGVMLRKPSETFHPKWSKDAREKASISHTKIKIDKDQLEDLYINHRLSIADLADVFGRGDSTIRNNLIKYNIPIRSLSDSIRNRKYSPETRAKISTAHKIRISKDFLVDQYITQNKTLSQIEREFDIGHSVLARRMSDYGISQRPSNESVSIGLTGKIRVPPELRKHIPKGYKVPGEWRIGTHHSDETRRKMSERAKGPLNHNWRNGARQQPYCFKFNFSLKEQIREAFGRRCLYCGSPENGHRLDVHHTDYNKMQGCKSKWNLVPLCNKCHGHVHIERWYWFSVFYNHWLISKDRNFNCLSGYPLTDQLFDF